MFERFKKFHWIVILSLLLLGTGYTFAFAITVDSKADAGTDYGQGAFARFVDASGSTLLNVLPTDNPFQSANDAYTFAQYISSWSLKSAGNIWAADTIVGYPPLFLPAGTYRITPTGGGFTYDIWGWSDPYFDRYLWELQIRANNAYENGQLVNSLNKTLGSDSLRGTADDAFDFVRNQYLDITLAEGGSLNFWIYDVNSLDNSGDLSFSVTAVPEPSTLLLLIMGLPVLLRRVRS